MSASSATSTVATASTSGLSAPSFVGLLSSPSSSSGAQPAEPTHSTTTPLINQTPRINDTNTSSNVNVGAIVGSVCAAIIIIAAVILLVRWKWRSQQQQKFKERFFSQRATQSQLEMSGNSGSSMIEHARAHTATTGSDSSGRFLLPVQRVEHGNVGQANVEQESDAFLSSKEQFGYFAETIPHRLSTKDHYRFSKASQELVLPPEVAEGVPHNSYTAGRDAARSIHVPEHMDPSDDFAVQSMRASICMSSMMRSGCVCVETVGEEGACTMCGSDSILRRSSVGSSMSGGDVVGVGVSRGVSMRIPGDLSRKGSAKMEGLPSMPSLSGNALLERKTSSGVGKPTGLGKLSG
ncbi:hypothetical protein BJ741DRAFT_636252 [Chytriomyces cf. hyalinus JEL632]|nr:hypothetical protein BJ741DRAFT_636252 [Chytriomyces cf. hyalinus JEL632]